MELLAEVIAQVQVRLLAAEAVELVAAAAVAEAACC